MLSKLLWSLLLVCLLSSCVTLPDVPPQPHVASLAPANAGLLSDFARTFSESHGDSLSGFYPMADNREALEMRLALVQNATASIDTKYFIWQGDEISNLLFLPVSRCRQGSAGSDDRR